MQNVIDTLRDEISLAAGGKCLLWVNPAQRDPYADHALAATRRVRVPIANGLFARELAPYFVPLDLTAPADAGLFTDSVQRAWQGWTMESLKASRGHEICGWITTQCAPGQLASHWGRYCHLHGHGGKLKLLRFHDPGVREWLWPTLEETQKQPLMRHASCLYEIGRDHALLRHACTQGAATASAFNLTARQWQQVDGYAAVHAAWLACPAAQRTPFFEQVVLEALSHAAGLGVTQDTERALYALHALQLGSRFHKDACMQGVWEQTRAGNYYGSAIEDTFACPANELHLHWTSPEEKQDGLRQSR